MLAPKNPTTLVVGVVRCLPFIAFGQTDYADRLMSAKEYSIIGNYKIEVIKSDGINLITIHNIPVRM